MYLLKTHIGLLCPLPQHLVPEEDKFIKQHFASMMLHQLNQTGTVVRRHASRSSVAPRPVLSGRHAFKQQQQLPANRHLSTVVRVAEMERTAEEDALMFCYQVCTQQQLLIARYWYTELC